MANQNAVDLELMFEEFVEGFDAACVLSKGVKTSYPNPVDMQRAGDTIYKKQDYEVLVTTGLDISGASDTDMIERFVPTVFRQPDNVRYAFDAKELRDPQHLKESGNAAARKLAGEIDTNLTQIVADQAGMIVTSTSALAYNDVAKAESYLLARGSGIDQGRKLFINPTDHISLSNELATRGTYQEATATAYERARIPGGIGGFEAFRTDLIKNSVVTGTVSGTTVNGNQSHTVSAMTSGVPTDNRRMVLNVAGANIGNIKAGDSFTIAGVNAVHNVTKDDTGVPMTFRVISVAGGGANLTITPAIVSSGPYQNVSTQAANTAALTFLNTATKPVNIFTTDGAITLDYGNLAFPTDVGPKVMTARTKQGVPLYMLYAFDIHAGKMFIRCTTHYATTVLQPEKCGLIIANQV